MSRAAVSSLTNTLSAAGLLDRTPGSADGRSVVLALTEKGTAAIDETFLRHNARETEWARLLDPEDLATLNALLAKLAAAAHEADWVNRR